MLPKLGILAGAGDLPRQIIDTCREQGREFFVIAFKGQTPPDSVEHTDHVWVRLGAAGKAIEYLHEAKVEELVMAGAIQRPNILTLMPDIWTTRFLAKVGYEALGDNGILSAIVKELEESEGFSVIGADSILPDVIMPVGALGRMLPDKEDEADIALGLVTAKDIGALDIGQGCVVRAGEVLATEDEFGTDAMLAKIKPAEGAPAGVLVKVKKPGQEERTDLPTIGLDTIENVHKAGLKGISTEADSSIILNRKAVIDRADELGLFILGVHLPESD